MGWSRTKTLQVLKLWIFRLLLIVGSVSILIILFNLTQHPFFEDLERKTFDWRASLEKGDWAEKASSNIVILNYDDPTLTLFEDEYGTWPWTRQVSADLIQWLNDEAHVGAIAFDLMFTHSRKGELAQGDENLVKAFQRYNNVYTSFNFDNNRNQLVELNKAPTAKDFENLLPGGIQLTSPSPEPYFMGEYSWLRLNNYRKVLPGLMAVPERLAVVNHIRDRDGVSRTNPLFFILDWGSSPDEQVVFPYLGLRLFMDRVVPPSLRHHAITLNEDNELTIGDIRIPLLDDGRFMVHWYNSSGDENYLKEKIHQLDQQLADPTHKLTIAQRAHLTQQRLNAYNDLTAATAIPIPYVQVPVWKVLNCIHGNASAESAEELKALLKDKIVFVGTSAVSTFDIKTTPIYPTIPGVVMQATIFDNLQQHRHFIRRVNASSNLAFSALLWLGCVLCIVYTTSAWIGVAGVGVCYVLYALAAFWLYIQYDLWVSIAAPMASGVIVTVLTYVVRYLSRTQDFERTYKLATTDAMTGLKNHRYFQEHLSNTLARCERANQPCGLLMIDVDYFKKFNDTYGHQAGDRVLKCVAIKLEQSVRRGDLVARYGGEEMAVVLANASAEEAYQVAQKLVQAVAQEPYPIAENVYKHITISVGVAVYPHHGLVPAQLIQTADEGLYRAKEAGRNQVGSMQQVASELIPTVSSGAE